MSKNKTPYEYDETLPASNPTTLVTARNGQVVELQELVGSAALNTLIDYSDYFIKAGTFGIKAAMKVVPKSLLAKFAADIYNKVAERDAYQARLFLNDINEFLSESDENIITEMEKLYTLPEAQLPRTITPELVISIRDFIVSVRNKAIPLIPSLSNET